MSYTLTIKIPVRMKKELLEISQSKKNDERSGKRITAKISRCPAFQKTAQYGPPICRSPGHPDG